MAYRVPITIRLDSFEGPLDLLLYLIQSHEHDISRISLVKVTDQYLSYVLLMQELNFDVASDFLVMAATLIQWKSKALLPVEQDPNALAAAAEDDVLSPEALLRQLMEHQRFLQAGQDLAALPLLGDDVFTRPNHRPPTEKVWKEMDITALAMSYQDQLVRARKRTTLLKKETVSLADKIMDFAGRMEIGKMVTMSSLLVETKSRPEVVVTFLASLELGRLKKMKLYQEGTYEEIYVELLESIKDFNLQLATGFDALQETVEKGLGDLNTLRDPADRAREDALHAGADLPGTAVGTDAGIPDDVRSRIETDLGDAAGTSGADSRADGAGVDRDAEEALTLDDADRDAGTHALAAHERGDAHLEAGSAGPGAAPAGSLDRSDSDELSGNGDSGHGSFGNADAGADAGNAHGIDLHAFGESDEPRLADVLSGRDHAGSGGDSAGTDANADADSALGIPAGADAGTHHGAGTSGPDRGADGNDHERN